MRLLPSLLLVSVSFAGSFAQAAPTPSYACTGSLAPTTGGKGAEINKLVILFPESGYTQETLARLGNYELRMWFTNDGKQVVSYLSRGESEMNVTKTSIADSRFMVPYRNTEVELDLRCAKIGE
ncbi:MAG: hypothetical protein JST04_16525 [Bdellovibrionales bacterium]|nr:hypothetical protein [Bdellovibrionales bacterium]